MKKTGGGSQTSGAVDYRGSATRITCCRDHTRPGFRHPNMAVIVMGGRRMPGVGHETGGKARPVVDCPAAPEVSVVSAVFGTTGVLLILVVVVDALWTALWVDGAAGPVTSRVSTWVWRSALRLLGRRHRMLSVFGPLILLGTVLGWLLGLWAGWVLLFAADPQSLIDTRNPGIADWAGRIWFVGYAMFTMGNGDFSPQDGSWQIIASLVNGSGMLLITLAITYLLSVISAVTVKRAFAASVHSLGGSGRSILYVAWNGRSFDTLDRQLTQLSSELASVTERYLAYPVLQYYHAARPEKSPAVAVAVLDDALTLLRFGVHSHARPNPAALSAARSTVASFLETLDAAFIPMAPRPPPLPALDELRDRGMPVVSDQEFAAGTEHLDDRRRAVLGLVHYNGWTY